MRKRVLTAIAILSIACASQSVAQDNADNAYERVLIEEVVQKFLSGVTNYDVNVLRQAFHPDARILYTTTSGQFTQLTQWDWYERIKRPSAIPRRKNSIISIDITGNAAIAKTESVFSDFKFTHYLSLLKIYDKWLIVNEVYSKEKLKAGQTEMKAKTK